MRNVPVKIFKDLDNFVTEFTKEIAVSTKKQVIQRIGPVRFTGKMEEGIVDSHNGKYESSVISYSEQGAHFELGSFGQVVVDDLIQEWCAWKKRSVPKKGSLMNVNFRSKKYRSGEQNQFMKKSVPSPIQVKVELDKTFAKNLKGGVINGK